MLVAIQHQDTQKKKLGILVNIFNLCHTSSFQLNKDFMGAQMWKTAKSIYRYIVKQKKFKLTLFEHLTVLLVQEKI